MTKKKTETPDWMEKANPNLIVAGVFALTAWAVYLGHDGVLVSLVTGGFLFGAGYLTKKKRG